MESKVEACAECTRSCVSLHRAKLDPYPIVCSFFKVMFGKQFSEELIVPPRFTKTLKSLEGKNAYLEDSTGQKWDVHLSKLKGSLVIQRGWQKFSLDHGIEIGDFVVFHYIKGSQHFIVQIFTRSGCERPVLFSEMNYQSKRVNATKDFDARRGSDGNSNPEARAEEVSGSPMAAGLDVDSVKSQDDVRMSSPSAEDCPVKGNTRKRHKIVPAEDYLAEPFFMTSRSASFSREDDRDYLFDLSAFEMPTKKVRTEETSITEVNRWQKINQLQNAQIGSTSADIVIALTSPLLASNVACLAKEEPNLLLKSSLDFAMPSNSNLLQRDVTPIAMEFPTEAANRELLGSRKRIVKKEQQPCQNNSGCTVAHNSCNVPRDIFVSRLKEPRSNNEDLDNFNYKVSTVEGFLEKVVKPEPVDFCGSTSALTIKITCSEQEDTEPFLELPECLPIKVSRHGSKMDQKLILLRDSAGKRWPVLYQERKGVKILANGWKEFRKHNSILPGDQCTFILENIEDCIFKVDILRG
ncbi:hypothetical protein KSS87_000057 [Heliosperma pusillum]|nr:hypothetical protein KSS87_000057 [Heliosperma pusillum]